MVSCWDTVMSIVRRMCERPRCPFISFCLCTLDGTYGAIPTRLRYDNLRAITIYNIQSLLIGPFEIWDL